MFISFIVKRHLKRKIFQVIRFVSCWKEAGAFRVKMTGRTFLTEGKSPSRGVWSGSTCPGGSLVPRILLIFVLWLWSLLLPWLLERHNLQCSCVPIVKKGAAIVIKYRLLDSLHHHVPIKQKNSESCYLPKREKI